MFVSPTHSSIAKVWITAVLGVSIMAVYNFVYLDFGCVVVLGGVLILVVFIVVLLDVVRVACV